MHDVTLLCVGAVSVVLVGPAVRCDPGYRADHLALEGGGTLGSRQYIMPNVLTIDCRYVMRTPAATGHGTGMLLLLAEHIEKPSRLVGTAVPRAVAATVSMVANYIAPGSAGSGILLVGEGSISGQAFDGLVVPRIKHRFHFLYPFETVVDAQTLTVPVVHSYHS